MPNNKFKNQFLIVVISLLDLTLLYYNKYAGNEMTLSDFRLFNFGNFIDFFIALLIISGTVISSLQKQKRQVINYRLILSLMIFGFILIVMVAFTNLFRIDFGDSYLLNYPINKAMPGLFYLSNKTLHVYLIFYIWLQLLSSKPRIFIRSLIMTGIAVIVMLLYSFFHTLTFSGKPVQDENVNV